MVQASGPRVEEHPRAVFSYSNRPHPMPWTKNVDCESSVSPERCLLAVSGLLGLTCVAVLVWGVVTWIGLSGIPQLKPRSGPLAPGTVAVIESTTREGQDQDAARGAGRSLVPVTPDTRSRQPSASAAVAAEVLSGRDADDGWLELDDVDALLELCGAAMTPAQQYAEQQLLRAIERGDQREIRRRADVLQRALRPTHRTIPR